MNIGSVRAASCLRVVICGVALAAASVTAQPADVLALGGADAATEAVFVRGLTAQWLGDHEEAITLFARVLERRPEEPAVLAAMARSDAALGRTAEALVSISRAAVLARGDRDIQWEAAVMQRDLGRSDDALATLTRLLASAPDDRDALDAVAQIHEAAGRPDAALDVLQRLLNTAGEREDLRLRMHAQMTRIGDDAGGLRVLEDGAAALPWARTLRLRLARAYVEAGRAPEASAVLDELLAWNPADGEAGALRDELAGGPRRAGGESDEARLRRAAAMIDDAREDPAMNDEARELLRPLVDGPSPSPDALRLMGLLEHGAGDHARAAQLLASSLGADPRHPDAWEALVESTRLRGDAREAADAADEALLLFPGRPSLLEAAAAAYSAAGRPDDARLALDQALALDERDGVTSAVRSRLEEARRSLE